MKLELLRQEDVAYVKDALDQFRRELSPEARPYWGPIATSAQVKVLMREELTRNEVGAIYQAVQCSSGEYDFSTQFFIDWNRMFGEEPDVHMLYPVWEDDDGDSIV